MVGTAHATLGAMHPKWRLTVSARFLGENLSAYLKSPKTFCGIAEAWASIAVADRVSIWLLARAVVSAAKSASSILDREASIF